MTEVTTAVQKQFLTFYGGWAKYTINDSIIYFEDEETYSHDGLEGENEDTYLGWDADIIFNVISLDNSIKEEEKMSQWFQWYLNKVESIREHYDQNETYKKSNKMD